MLTAIPRVNFVRKAARVSGEIMSLQARYGEKKNYIADVKYTVEGKDYHSEFRLRRNRYSVGQSVPLLVAREKPQHAEIDDFFRLYLWPVVFLCFGLIGFIPLFQNKPQ